MNQDTLLSRGSQDQDSTNCSKIQWEMVAFVGHLLPGLWGLVECCWVTECAPRGLNLENWSIQLSTQILSSTVAVRYKTLVDTVESWALQP